MHDFCVADSKQNLLDGGGGAAVAQWIRLRLPSCRPKFESQVHFYQFKNVEL